MHYTLDQCKEIARLLLSPTDRVPLKVVLDHELPWPSDTEVRAYLLEANKSKKRAASLLGITKKCLRRRLREIKERGLSNRLLPPLTVHEVLDRLLHNQSFQQISEETEIHQSLLCRLVSGLIIAIKQPALVQHAPVRRHRNSIIASEGSTGQTTWIATTPVVANPYHITGAPSGRITYDTSAINMTSMQIIASLVNSSTNNNVWTEIDFTGGTPNVESEHGTTPQLPDETPDEGPTTGGA
jgi:hypothetical protein